MISHTWEEIRVERGTLNPNIPFLFSKLTQSATKTEKLIKAEQTAIIGN